MTNSIKDKNIKWWIGAGSCIMLFGFIIVFSFFKTTFLIEGVKLTANIIRDKNSSLVEVSGKANGATYLRLNGREIFIDKDGSFKEDLILLPGLSVVTLSSEDQFGNTIDKKFELVYKEPGASVAINK